jgi:lipopolysaccharide/colanic/teichoic acid biosynthesis glycosyltransferase
MSGSSRSSLYRRAGKRTLDVLLAAPALVLTAPVVLLLSGLVWLRLGRPVFFRQLRPGRDGVPFRIVKLRTMREIVPGTGAAPSDESRLTGFGRMLRRWSLDELPELWNVLRGEMSLVGPRPLLMEYLPRYDERQWRRHDVLPGLTGWAQVNGRNETSWARRLEMDAWYSENLSLRLDLAILARTLLMVASGAGVSAPGQATMPPFGEGESD